MTDLRKITTIFLSVAVGLIIFALVTDFWTCGTLFNDCKNKYNEVVTAFIALLIIGGVCLVIVVILDLIGLCSKRLTEKTGYVLSRFVLLYVSAACLLTAVLLFTAKVS